MTEEGRVPAVRRPRAVTIVGAAILVVVVVAAVAVYVVNSGEPADRVEGIAPVSPDPFSNGVVRPGPHEAEFDPRGARLAVLTAGRLGLAVEGDVEYLTPDGSSVVDFAWFPAGSALIVGEGPVPTGFLVVLSVDGATLGRVPLEDGLGLGEGYGMAVAPNGREAVVTAVTRDALGEEMRYLVQLDLETGESRPLTAAGGESEWAPFFVGSHRVVFNRGDERIPEAAVVDTRTGTRRVVRGAGRVVGVAGGWIVTEVDDTVIAFDLDGREHRMGRVPPGAAVVAVDPTGRRAVVVTTTGAGEASAAQLAEVELDPPRSPAR